MVGGKRQMMSALFSHKDEPVPPTAADLGIETAARPEPGTKKETASVFGTDVIAELPLAERMIRHMNESVTAPSALFPGMLYY
jgi:hypothetical protein